MPVCTLLVHAAFLAHLTAPFPFAVGETLQYEATLGVFPIGTATVTVNLTGVTNAQNITVALIGVNNGGDLPVQMSVLVGDTTGDGTVNASDVRQPKMNSGQVVDAANFRTDVNANGSINATDVALVKLHSGVSQPVEIRESGR